MGEVFAGRYELADPIGRGGVGAVWRAWDHRRRRYVAAKVLQQRDAHSLLRFVREQALRIDHPHVLAPASWAADDDKVLFTMDLVAGGSLVHLVGDYGPLPPAYVCTLLDQLLSGLAAVHEEGVVHRDIKPANLLLEATGTGRPRLRLSDFGIAMRLGEPRLTETNLVVGTPGYLAPEQMLGAEPDFPADLFAVGLVALYLLEGAKPDAKVLVQYFAEHGTPPAPKGIPEPLWQIVAGLLQPDPAARFRTATGARKALAAAAELLPEPDLDDELIEIFDQLGPLPPGFGPAGPLKQAPAVAKELIQGADRDDPDRYAPDGNTDKDADRDRDANRGRDGDTDSGADSGRTGTGGTEPTGTGSLSDTGSFRLPPPQDLPTPAPEPHVFPHGSTRDGPRNSPRPPADPPPSPAAPPPFLPPHPQPQSPTPYPLAPWATDPLTADPSAGDPSVTASYTAREPQLPPVPRQMPQAMAGQMARTRPPGHGRRGRRARRDRRRPGPPAKAAVPILLLALVCYAVGFWALARVV